MGIQASQPIVGGVYPLGSGSSVALGPGGGITSDVLNARDLGQAGAPDFVVLGPGSQVWFLGYSVRATTALAAVPDTLGLELAVRGSFDQVVPFIFATVETLRLPVYGSAASPLDFTGRIRVEHSAAQLSLVNGTGADLTVSFQFWGKAL